MQLLIVFQYPAVLVVLGFELCTNYIHVSSELMLYSEQETDSSK